MSSASLEYLEVNPDGDPDAAIVWLHGLGADGHDFYPIVPELGLPSSHRIRFVFPHAPTRPITINQGMSMRAWYDIKEFGLAPRQDEEGIRDSEKLIFSLIKKERARGISASRIILAGFSQGGAMALHCGLRCSPALAGIMALSSYLLLPDQTKEEAGRKALGLPIFMAHGTHDPVVPHAYGKLSCEILEQLGASNISWHSYPIAHSVNDEEIRAIGTWIQKVLLT